MFLLAVEVASIQDYIFNSNRLKENIGASHLVKVATEDWAYEALRTTCPKNNLEATNNAIVPTARIEDPKAGLDAELVYAAGGNFVVLFRNETDAQSFAGKLSRRVLCEAPGLHMTIAYEAFHWETASLSTSVRYVIDKNKRRRNEQPNIAPLRGLGVTVMCRSTAMPATRVEDKLPISSEVYAKQKAAVQANSRLQETFQLPDGFTYTDDFEKLGRTRGESSYIGVVHADGDGIGALIRGIGERHNTPVSNRNYIDEIRNFSENLKKAAQEALERTIKTLNNALEAKHLQQAGFELTLGEDNKEVLPIRLLVYGGDDVTFVCDGRLALALTTLYQQAFEQATERHIKQRLTACAGVSIVKVRYPFARAYKLAEALCSSAKAYKKRASLDSSCLDWHLSMSGLFGEIDSIREREYRVPSGSLTLRPVALQSTGLRTWENITTLFETFTGEEWQDKRNKLKALREALRGGKEVVKHFCIQYGQKLPQLENVENGWAVLDGSPYCAYFDAIELADLHIDLKEFRA
jgi:hypothetical protein